MKRIAGTEFLTLALFILAALLRIYEIDSKNLWFDEIYSWKVSNGNIASIFADAAGDIHPPLFYLLLKLWNLIFSDSVTSMRMFSVALSLAAMYMLLKVSRTLMPGRLESFFVLLLYAISPLNIFYSQEVRMLNLNLLLTISSVYFLIRYLERPRGMTGVAYIIATVLSLYTHYFALFVLLAQMVYLGVIYYKEPESKPKVWTFLKYPVFSFAMFIPWFPIMAGQAMKGQPWRTSQSIGEIGEGILGYFKDIFLSPYYPFESMLVMYTSHIVSILVILFLLLGLARKFNSGKLIESRSLPAYILFFVPLILAALVSVKQSIVFSRYLSVIIPYLFITLVSFAFDLYSKRVSILICSSLVAVSAYGTAINFSNDFKNNDYRRIIAYISENISEGDKLIVEPHFMGWVFNYHNRNGASNIPDPTVLGWNLNMQIDSLQSKNGIGNFWFVSDYSSLDTNGFGIIPERLDFAGFEQISEKTFYLIPAKVKVSYFGMKRTGKD